MFIGHYGMAFALKRAEPKLSLGTLFLATQLVDLAWGATILLGWERVSIEPGWTAASPLRFISYPITHSLLAAGLWATAAAIAWYTWPTRDTSRHARAALIVALAVASHWFLDLVVHVPDLPLAGDDTQKVRLRPLEQHSADLHGRTHAAGDRAGALPGRGQPESSGAHAPGPSASPRSSPRCTSPRRWARRRRTCGRWASAPWC